MIVFKLKRPRENNVVGIENTIVEIVKDGEVVARIYPNKDSIKFASENFKSVKVTNGEDYVPQIPMVIIDF